MLYEKIYFNENDPSVYLENYVYQNEKLPPRDAILIIPGGGYTHVCIDREGECTALAYATANVVPFVLFYNTDEDRRFPSHLLDAARAMKYIKDNAEKYNINPDRIFALGYSAGGHLCGTLAVHHALAEKELGYPENSTRPHGIIMCYPVVSACLPTHGGSMLHLLGKPVDQFTDEEKNLVSIEKNVTEKTPPAFIWHTSEDYGVPIYGSLELAKAYYRLKMPVELHVYPYDGHGSGLCTEITSNGMQTHVRPENAAWLENSVRWMKSIR